MTKLEIAIRIERMTAQLQTDGLSRLFVADELNGIAAEIRADIVTPCGPGGCPGCDAVGYARGQIESRAELQAANDRIGSVEAQAVRLLYERDEARVEATSLRSYQKTIAETAAPLRPIVTRNPEILKGLETIESIAGGNLLGGRGEAWHRLTRIAARIGRLIEVVKATAATD